MGRWVTILTFIIVTFIQTGNAQIAARDGFEVGGNLSVSTSWILNQNAFELFNLTCDDEGLWGSEPDYKITMGYSGGVSAAFRSKDFWGVMAEINYAKAGQNYKDGFTTTICPDHSNFERNFVLHYLQVPLMVKFTATNRRDVKWYVLTGPQLGFLLGAKETVIIGDTEQASDMFTPAKEKVKSFDFDFVLGAGADIFVSRNLYINVGLKTYIGLTDINGDAVKEFISKNDGSYQASRNFNAGIHVGVHYIFDWVGAYYR